jgi:hypothetical protein
MNVDRYERILMQRTGDTTSFAVAVPDFFSDVGDEQPGAPWKGESLSYNVDKPVYCEPFADAESTMSQEKQRKKWKRK